MRVVHVQATFLVQNQNVEVLHMKDLLGLKLGVGKSLVGVLMPQKFESIWINLAYTSFTKVHSDQKQN